VVSGGGENFQGCVEQYRTALIARQARFIALCIRIYGSHCSYRRRSSANKERSNADENDLQRAKFI